MHFAFLTYYPNKLISFKPWSWLGLAALEASNAIVVTFVMEATMQSAFMPFVYLQMLCLGCKPFQDFFLKSRLSPFSTNYDFWLVFTLTMPKETISHPLSILIIFIFQFDQNIERDKYTSNSFSRTYLGCLPSLAQSK